MTGGGGAQGGGGGAGIEVGGVVYDVVPVATDLPLPSPLLDVFDGETWVTRSSDRERIESQLRLYQRAGAEEHWTATYRMPDAMPPPGSLYPPSAPQRTPLPEITALGVCASCGWIHTRCKGHAKTDGGAPCGGGRRRGQLVCSVHGGNQGAALEKAEKTMTERKSLAEVGRLIAEAELEVDGKSGAERLVAAMNRAGAMALSYRWLLDALPAESQWSWVEHTGDSAPTRWVDVSSTGLLGPDAKGQMTLHPYEEALRYWTKLEGDLLVQAAKLGLDERRQLFAESQVARIGDAATALVGGLGHSLDDPKVVPLVEAFLRMIAGDEAEPAGAEPIEIGGGEPGGASSGSVLWGDG